MPEPPDLSVPTRRIVGAWTLGALGVLWAYVLALALAMQTAPSVSAGQALMMLPPSLLALALAGGVIRDAVGGRVRKASIGWVMPAVALGAVGLLIGIASYFG